MERLKKLFSNMIYNCWWLFKSAMSNLALQVCARVSVSFDHRLHTNTSCNHATRPLLVFVINNGSFLHEIPDHLVTVEYRQWTPASNCWYLGQKPIFKGSRIASPPSKQYYYQSLLPHNQKTCAHGSPQSARSILDSTAFRITFHPYGWPKKDY